MSNLKLKKAFELIEQHICEGDFDKPKSDELIKIAESELGLSFPPSYLEFLKKYGCGSLAGFECFGLTCDTNFKEAGIPNAIGVTLSERNDSALPPHYIIIADAGDGPYYCIDCSIKNKEGESPIVIWASWFSEPEKVAEDFGEFLLTSLKNRLES